MDLDFPKNEMPCAAEMPVELWVNDKKLTAFLCTPSDLEDLAVGHLLTRGYLSDQDEILDLETDLNCFRIRVSVDSQELKSQYSVSEMILSGCSTVAEFSSQVYDLHPKTSSFCTTLSHLRELGNQMIEGGIIYKKTGGVHAALVESGNCQLVREDIGRHNAVDKVVGAAVRAGLSLSEAALITTGRISLDMALKSAAVSIPVIGTLKYPSDLGARLGEFYHICIVSCILSEQPLVYTAKDKIIDEEVSLCLED